jgi:hypothetical protein
MRLFSVALSLFMLASGLACNRTPSGPNPSASTTAAGAAPATTEPNRGWPTKDEVLEYLDGKSITLADPTQPPRPENKPHIIKREQIEVLEVATVGSSSGGSPWSTSIDFVLNTGQVRYAVTGRVEHKLIEKKRVFYGFTISQAAKQ